MTEDEVTNDFRAAIEDEVIGRLGSGHLRGYEWAGDDEDNWPFIVTTRRDGREFEIDIYVRVTELTPEVKARREADAKALLARLEELRELKRQTERISELQRMYPLVIVRGEEKDSPK